MSDNNNSGSFLRQCIRSIREQSRSLLKDAQENYGLLHRSYNQTIYEPISVAIDEIRDSWRDVRREHPGSIVGGATAIAMLSSIRFGRWAFIRNTILTAGGSFALTSPEIIADILTDSRRSPMNPESDQSNSSS